MMFLAESIQIVASEPMSSSAWTEQQLVLICNL